jgi:hypothetical protein
MNKFSINFKDTSHQCHEYCILSQKLFPNKPKPALFSAKSISNFAMISLPFYPDIFTENVSSSIFIETGKHNIGFMNY